jgi:hypothetical protein
MTDSGHGPVPPWVKAEPTDVLLTRALLPVVHRAGREEVDEGLAAALDWALGSSTAGAPITGRRKAPDAFSVRVEFLAAIEASGNAVPDHLYDDLGAIRAATPPARPAFAAGAAYMLGWLVGVYDRPPLDIRRDVTAGAAIPRMFRDQP